MNPSTSSPCGVVLGLAALFAAAPALSQQAGHYSGLTSQGQPISLDITIGADGKPVLLDVVAFYETQCATSGRTLTAGYAAIPNVPLNDQGGLPRRGIYVIWAYGWMKTTFDGVATFSGTTGVTSAMLLPTLPVVAENCFAPKVGFSATLDSGALPATVPAGLPDSQAMTELSLDGRVAITRGEPILMAAPR